MQSDTGHPATHTRPVVVVLNHPGLCQRSQQPLVLASRQGESIEVQVVVTLRRRSRASKSMSRTGR